MRAPTGPARDFTPARAQAWVLMAAVVTGIIYTFRKVIEPVTPSSAKSSLPSKLLGAGPPPSVEQWAVSYGAAFLMLSVIAVVSPETAGSMAILIVVGTLLANGTAIVKDINSLK